MIILRLYKLIFETIFSRVKDVKTVKNLYDEARSTYYSYRSMRRNIKDNLDARTGIIMANREDELADMVDYWESEYDKLRPEDESVLEAEVAEQRLREAEQNSEIYESPQTESEYDSLGRPSLGTILSKGKNKAKNQNVEAKVKNETDDEGFAIPRVKSSARMKDFQTTQAGPSHTSSPKKRIQKQEIKGISSHSRVEAQAKLWKYDHERSRTTYNNIVKCQRVTSDFRNLIERARGKKSQIQVQIKLPSGEIFENLLDPRLVKVLSQPKIVIHGGQRHIKWASSLTTLIALSNLRQTKNLQENEAEMIPNEGTGTNTSDSDEKDVESDDNVCQLSTELMSDDEEIIILNEKLVPPKIKVETIEESIEEVEPLVVLPVPAVPIDPEPPLANLDGNVVLGPMNLSQTREALDKAMADLKKSKPKVSEFLQKKFLD